jgi:hypothetical protein
VKFAGRKTSLRGRRKTYNAGKRGKIQAGSNHMTTKSGYNQRGVLLATRFS